MEKILIIIIALINLFSGNSSPEMNIDEMSFSDLITLREEVNSALWGSEELKSVTVPVGVYKIGNEIPVGKWVIRPVEGSTAMIIIGTKTKNNGMEIEPPYWHEQITSPSDSYSKYNKTSEVVVTLESGYISIGQSPVYFEPYLDEPFEFN